MLLLIPEDVEMQKKYVIDWLSLEMFALYFIVALGIVPTLIAIFHPRMWPDVFGIWCFVWVSLGMCIGILPKKVVIVDEFHVTDKDRRHWHKFAKQHRNIAGRVRNAMNQSFNNWKAAHIHYYVEHIEPDYTTLVYRAENDGKRRSSDAVVLTVRVSKVAHYIGLRAHDANDVLVVNENVTSDSAQVTAITAVIAHLWENAQG